MVKRSYVLEFQEASGVWLPMPATDDPRHIAALVESLLPFRRLPGEFIRVSIVEDYRQE